MWDALPRWPHGRFGGGEVPARPGYPFSPGGALVVFKNTGVSIQRIHTGGFTASAALGAENPVCRVALRARRRCSLARCVHALAPALCAHAWPDRCERAGCGDRERVRLRVVAGWLP